MAGRQTTLDEYWFKKIPKDIFQEIIDDVLKEDSNEELDVIQSDASVHASIDKDGNFDYGFDGNHDRDGEWVNPSIKTEEGPDGNTNLTIQWENSAQKLAATAAIAAMAIFYQ